MSDTPIGAIIMFSGETIPDGWLLCNGKNGTPNLIDRFILGGVKSEDNPNDKKITGSGSSREIVINTQTCILKISGKTEGHVLSESELPPHNHISGIPSQWDYDFDYGVTLTQTKGKYLYGGKPEGTTSPRYYAKTSSVGSGSQHTHNIDLTLEHHHEVDIIPPYYVLAFIMRVS